MAATLPPLSGDGVVDALFQYLALENEEGSTCPGVRVPETVVYKYRSPAYWFHTDEDHLDQRAKWEVKNNRIEDLFGQRRKPKCEIVASYISVSGGGEGKTALVEFFDQQGLHDFLFFRNKVNNGILQKFVDPRGKSNFVIRVVWTPNILIMEQATNKAVLSNTRLEMYERAVTFEGADHLREITKLRGERVRREISEICLNVVDHVQRTTHSRHRIARMVLNFRIDDDDRIWLLYCSSVRLEGAKLDLHRPLLAQMHQPLDMQPGVAAPKAAKQREGGAGQDRLFRLHYFECPSCASVTEKQLAAQHEVSYREYLRHWESEEARKRAAAAAPAGLGASPSALALSRPGSASTTRRPRSAAATREPPPPPAVVASYLQTTAAQKSRERAVNDQLAAIEAAAPPPRPGTARAGSARLSRTRTAPSSLLPAAEPPAPPAAGSSSAASLRTIVAPPSLAAAAAGEALSGPDLGLGRPSSAMHRPLKTFHVHKLHSPSLLFGAAPQPAAPAPAPAQPEPPPAPSPAKAGPSEPPASGASPAQRPRPASAALAESRGEGAGAGRRPASAVSKLRSLSKATGAAGAGRVALPDESALEAFDEPGRGVPPLIAVMHPQLTRAEFERVREKREWQERSALVCDKCFMEISKCVMDDMKEDVVKDGAVYAQVVLEAYKPEARRLAEAGPSTASGLGLLNDPVLVRGLLDGEYVPA